MKFEVVGGVEGSGCSFVEETNTGLLTITNWESKPGEKCEPVSVEWETDDAIVTKVTAFGGTDCDTVEFPESGSSYEADRDGEAGLDGPGGNTAAVSNLQFCLEPGEPEEPPECPAGTANLAGYRVIDGEFVLEEGEDVVEFSNVMTDSDGVKAFDFSSVDGSDGDSAPEVLTTVTVAYGETVETFEVDPDFDQDKRAGSMDLTSESEGVESVWFCQAVYAEADFVEGPVIQRFCDEDGSNIANYGSRKISSVSWSSYNGQLDGIQGQFDGSWIFEEAAGEIEVSYDPTVDYRPEEEFDRLSLSVFEIGDPTFKDNTHVDYGETKCRHVLHDSDADSSGELDGSLRASLPSIE